MEVCKETKEDIYKIQLALKYAINAHQALFSRLSHDDSNEVPKIKIKEADMVILTLIRRQREILDRLRREIDFYRTKVNRNDVTLESDIGYVAQQLKDYMVQCQRRKSSNSLLKNSVLDEIKQKGKDALHEHGLSQDKRLESSKLKADFSTNLVIKNDNVVNQNLLHKSEKKSLPKQPSASQLNIVEDKRANFVNALNKVKNSLCSSLESSVTVTCVQPLPHSSPQQPTRGKSTHMNTDQDTCNFTPHMPSPSPSPPLLPRLPGPGETLDKESFLRHFALITMQQREEIERKRSERKKRPTTSTNKNEFVYGSYEKRKKYNQFPYLQQHTPPQTRAKERLKRQRRLQRLQRTEEASPPQSMESSPQVSPSHSRVSETPAWIASLPRGLTVEPLYGKGAKKSCGVCSKDTTSSLYRCTNCDLYFHLDCIKDNSSEEESESHICPSCGFDVPDSLPVTLTPVPSTSARLNGISSEESLKIKEAKRALLVEENTRLVRQLRSLEARSTSIQDKIKVSDDTTTELLAKNDLIRQRLQKLLDVVHFFQDTSTNVKLSFSDSDSDHSKTSK